MKSKELYADSNCGCRDFCIPFKYFVCLVCHVHMHMCTCVHVRTRAHTHTHTHTTKQGDGNSLYFILVFALGIVVRHQAQKRTSFLYLCCVAEDYDIVLSRLSQVSSVGCYF